ncbi:hypothetical protein CR513_50044, partial [Mucuna pruriens]
MTWDLVLKVMSGVAAIWCENLTYKSWVRLGYGLEKGQVPLVEIEFVLPAEGLLREQLIFRFGRIFCYSNLIRKQDASSFSDKVETE